jgi:hypothetical protein
VFICVPPTLTLPLSFDPEALDGEGGGEGGGDFLWLRLCRAKYIRVPIKTLRGEERKVSGEV